MASQGQESDDEVRNGKGNSVNYKYRMHDPRIGRFFAVDPLASEFAWNSSYAFSENRVLDAIELEGAEATSVKTLKNTGKPEIKINIAADAYNNSATMTYATMNSVITKATAILKQMESETVSTNVSIRQYGAKSASVDGTDKFVVTFEDNLLYKGQAVPAGTLGFTEGGIGKTNENTFKVKSLGNSQEAINSMARTLAHEIGHGIGLAHPDYEDARIDGKGFVIFNAPLSPVTVKEDETNIMRQTKRTTGTTVHPKQANEVAKVIQSNGGETTVQPKRNYVQMYPEDKKEVSTTGFDVSKYTKKQ